MNKLFFGTVVKRSGDKTVKVVFLTTHTNSKYDFTYSKKKIVLVHDEQNTLNIGDLISFTETRKLSAKKHYNLYKKENKNG